MRERIAHQAARLIAEDGLQDYASAKRKAARQIGAPDTRNLPDNDEVERALREYLALYQRDEQSARLRQLRQQALEAMRLLAPFNPYLTGSVLTGTAARHSDINLQLFTDSAKEVELFLLARQVPYKSGEKHFHFGGEERPIPVFTLLDGPAEINVTVFATEDIRRISRHAEKNARAHARLVEALLEEG
jgi:predicted nucleotidyltransferase